jgi:hypothetical protein
MARSLFSFFFFGFWSIVSNKMIVDGSAKPISAPLLPIKD